MAKSITEYDILISCPGDVASCVEIIERVIEKFNKEFSRHLAIRLNPQHWSTSSYNQSGGKAQDLLNKQFIHECDAAIAIFWTRFGTPTDRYGSGTEEEIEDMLANGKQVFLYFCEKGIDPKKLLDEDVHAQYRKVKEYQKKYEQEGKGIYSSFASDEEFETKLFAHISKHFLTVERLENEKNKRMPVLQVKGIIDEKQNDAFFVEDIRFPVKSIKERCEEIRELYHSIGEYNLKPPVPIVRNPWALDGAIDYKKKVEFPEDKQKYIETFAKKAGIRLGEGFFDLGNLREDPFRGIAYIGGGSLVGEDEEIDKYNALFRLHKKIDRLIQWGPFEQAFEGLKCIRLAVANDGTDFDEDIDVSLRFKPNTLILPDELPEIDTETCKYIVNQGSMSHLFGIQATAYYNDFDSSKKSFSPITYDGDREHVFDPFGTHDYQADYADDLNSTFEYGFFPEGEDTVVELHIDYLKHNTAVAFPTVLFVSEDLSEIEYVIRSKRRAEETKGTIRRI